MQADQRIAKGDKVRIKDVFYFLQKGKDPETGEGFTLHELVAEASLLILGGRVFFLPHTLPFPSKSSARCLATALPNE